MSARTFGLCESSSTAVAPNCLLSSSTLNDSSIGWRAPRLREPPDATTPRPQAVARGYIGKYVEAWFALLQTWGRRSAPDHRGTSRSAWARPPRSRPSGARLGPGTSRWVPGARQPGRSAPPSCPHATPATGAHRARGERAQVPFPLLQSSRCAAFWPTSRFGARQPAAASPLASTLPVCGGLHAG